jgi:hypothetical protein
MFKQKIIAENIVNGKLQRFEFEDGSTLLDLYTGVDQLRNAIYEKIKENHIASQPKEEETPLKEE